MKIQFSRTLVLRLAVVMLFVAAITSLQIHVLAQDAGAPTADPNAGQAWYLMLWNTFGGVAVSFVVSALKNMSWAKNHPKLVALGVTLAVTFLPIIAKFPFASKGVGAFLVSALTTIFAAIGTHEVIVNPFTQKAPSPDANATGRLS